MRVLRRVGAVVGVVLAMLVAATWLVPPMLDWTRYRDEIATLATQQLGRTVRIDGPVSLALLPEPVLTASRVSVDERDRSDRDDAAGPRLALGVQQMRLRVGLAALLSGRIDARELVLRGFELRLPWPLDTSVGALRAPTWLSALSARIEDGRVSLGDVAATGIEATLAAGGLTGSYQAAGVATLSGRAWRFTLRATQPGADGSSGIDVTLDGQGAARDLGLVLSGQLDGAGNFGGRVAARGPDLSQLLPAPRVAFRAEGRVSVAGGLAAADDLAVEIGGSPARGAVAFRLSPAPRLDAALAVGRIDLNAWLPTLVRGGPPGISLGIDLSAEAADMAGGTLRHLRGAFDLAAGTVAVREFQALLPGDADLRLSGAIRPAGAAPVRFEGEARLAAPALRATLAWAERAGAGPLSTLPAEVLRSADLEGRLIVEPGLAAVSGLVGRIDASAVSGSVAARIGARLALSAGLRVDQLALDPWLPATAVPADMLAERLRGFDVDLRLDAARVSARGVTAAPFAFDGVADGGTVTVRRIDLAVGEAHLAASGSVSAAGRIADAKLDLRAREAEPLAAMLPDPVAAWLRAAPTLLRSPVRVQASGAGPADAVGVRLVAELGDLRLEAQPTLDLARAHWSGPLTLRHPGAPRLAEALGLTGATAWLGDGSLALVATGSGAPGRLAADDFDLTAGGLHASGGVVLDRSASRPMLTGRIAAETLPLPLPYARSPAPLPVGALLGWDASLGLTAGQVLVGAAPVLEGAAGALVLRDGLLRLDGVTGHLGGGSLAGALAFDAASRPPSLAVEARVQGASVTAPLLDTSIDLTAGRVDASASLRASGFAPAALLSTLTGTADIEVAGGSLSGIGLNRLASLSDADIKAGLAGGATAFDRLGLSARLRGGVAGIERATLETASVTALLGGTLDLAGAMTDLRLAVVPGRGPDGADRPVVGERLTGSVEALRRTPELAGLADWRARHAEAPDARQ